MTAGVTRICPLDGVDVIVTELQTRLQAVIDVINGWDAANTILDVPTVTWQTLPPDGQTTGVDATKLRVAIQ